MHFDRLFFLILFQIFLGRLSRFLCIPRERYVSVPTEDGAAEADLNPSELRVEPGLGITADNKQTAPAAAAGGSAGDGKLERTLDEISQYLRILATSSSNNNKEKSTAATSYQDTVCGEWQQFALVLNRLLFFTYLVLALLIAAIMYGHKQRG